MKKQTSLCLRFILDLSILLIVRKRIVMAMTAVTISLAVLTSVGTQAKTHQRKQSQNAKHDQADLSHLIWVRILPFEIRDQGWQLKNHSGQDVLNMIEELKPDVLDRFITGKPDLGVEVPMGSGVAPMKLVDYLDAAMKAGAPGCFLTPKDHLNDIWSDDYRMEAAQALYDLPVTPRLKTMDLDEFFTHGTPEEHQQTLEKFKAMGWRYLGYNFAGGPKPAYGLISYAEAGVNKNTWEVNLNALAAMKEEGIKIRLAHIDYPGAIVEFEKLLPDRQADIIQKIRQEQHQYGFTFIYPILYQRKGYDATKEVTKRNGPYHGATVFQIIKEDIRCDRQYPAPCSPRFTGQTAIKGGDAPEN